MNRWNCIKFHRSKSRFKRKKRSNTDRNIFDIEKRRGVIDRFWQWCNDDLRYDRLSLEIEKGRIDWGERSKIFYFVDTRGVIVPPRSFHGFLDIHASLERKGREGTLPRQRIGTESRRNPEERNGMANYAGDGFQRFSSVSTGYEFLICILFFFFFFERRNIASPLFRPFRQRTRFFMVIRDTGDTFFPSPLFFFPRLKNYSLPSPRI